MSTPEDLLGLVNTVQACPLLLNININKYQIVLQIVLLKIDICMD